MASPSDIGTSQAADTSGAELLPLSPFDSLKYHFGMLLGVDDFETEQAYHRAKMRLHNAWLHRQGVVWGYGVGVENDRGEIRVKAGLALDAAGRELHLDEDHCVNVAEWFDKHKGDPGFDLVRDAFDVHVVICFKACLDRQVPALLQPCDNGGTGTTYSRIHETVEIRLLPALAGDRAEPYRRLRILFGIEEPQPLDQATFDQLAAATELRPEDKQRLDTAKADRQVLTSIDEIEALGVDQQAAALLKAFHEFAALDEIDLQPATSDGRRLLFPGTDDDCVVLANITELKLTQQDKKWILSGGKVDSSVRPSHVATTTIQDLLCGRFGASTSPNADTGPRIDPASVALTSNAVIFTSDKPLHPASIAPIAFSVTFFDTAQGWRTSNVTAASYAGDETKTISLQLDGEISGLVRLMVSGSGPAPILGADLVPLAGAKGGPPASPHNGRDFVLMKDFDVTPEDLGEEGLSADPENGGGGNETEPVADTKNGGEPGPSRAPRAARKRSTSRK
ncbi:MAG TPA: hypothetical protein VFX97_10165 [Pyrinomonadaceae bacterium]|nr:hypothetical protein [Pyrinomonadaceae bacterium]